MLGFDREPRPDFTFFDKRLPCRVYNQFVGLAILLVLSILTVFIMKNLLIVLFFPFQYV
jgi:hypothetical protein